MNKSLDYEELWDSFTEEERRALLSNLPTHIERYEKQLHKQWKFLDVTLRIELTAVDWEFSLGRRFNGK